MKRCLLISVLCLPLLAKAQSLRIYQLGLGDGDACLITVIDDVNVSPFAPAKRDTAVILIDAQRENTGDILLNYVYGYLVNVLHRPRLDYAVVSHMHFDHYGGMFTVLYGLMQDGVKVGAVYDRTIFNRDDFSAPDVDDQDDAAVCFDYEDVDIKSVRSAAAKRYTLMIRANNLLKFLDLGEDLLKDKNFKNISMQCIAGYGASLTYNPQTRQTGKAFFIPGGLGQKYHPRSENDLSYAFLLSFQGFHYYTAGDLGGANTGGYSDGETPVTVYLHNRYGNNFHFCAMKVSHHGSSHSTSAYFVAQNQPTVAVFPAALRTYGRSTNPLPTKSTYDVLENEQAFLYFTFRPQNPENPASYYTKSKPESLADICLSIEGPPGYDNISIHVQGWLRSTQDYSLGKKYVDETDLCRKKHNF